MTKQELFNKVRKHLLTQRKQAREEGPGGCMYRTDAGLSCAVGCLIPEEHYRAGIEGMGAHSHMVADLLKKIGIIPADERFVPSPRLAAVFGEYYEVNDGTYLSLLRSLQDVHDHEKVEEWEEKLANVAEYHGLAVE